jgi:hypothetical protein
MAAPAEAEEGVVSVEVQLRLIGQAGDLTARERLPGVWRRTSSAAGATKPKRNNVRDTSSSRHPQPARLTWKIW